jgi:hypothetical protein
MKKIAFTLLVLTFVLSSCKYEEGPGISLISKRDRMANEWSIINYKIDGNDHDSSLKTFREPGDTIEVIMVTTRQGQYAFNRQFTKEHSKKNNNAILTTQLVNKQPIVRLYENLNNNAFTKATGPSGKWEFTQRHDKVYFGPLGNMDVSHHESNQVLTCEIVKLKNKEMKLSFTAEDGKKHLLTFQAWNYETPRQRDKNK